MTGPIRQGRLSCILRGGSESYNRILCLLSWQGGSELILCVFTASLPQILGFPAIKCKHAVLTSDFALALLINNGDFSGKAAFYWSEESAPIVRFPRIPV